MIQNTAWADYLELAQFVDFGQGWDVNLKTPSPKNIASVGVGVRWALSFLRPISHPAAVRNVLGTSINKSFES